MSNYLKLKKMLFIVVLSTIAIVLGVIELPMILPWLKLDLSEVIILVAVLVVGYKGAFSVVFLRAFGRRIYKLIAPALIPTVVVEDPIMGLIGEMIAIIASTIIILAYYFISKKLKTHRKPLLEVVDVERNKVTIKEIIFVTLTITFALSVVLVTFNFFIGTPLYFSYFAVLLGAMDKVHLTAFGFVGDPNLGNAVDIISSIFGSQTRIFEPNLNAFLIYNLVSYVPFNLGKGLLTSFVFLALKPRIQKLEL